MHPGDFRTHYNEVNIIAAASSFLANFFILFLGIDALICLPSTDEETTVRKQHCESPRAHEQGKFVSLSTLLLFRPQGIFLVKNIAPVQSNEFSLIHLSYPYRHLPCLFCVFVCFRNLSCKFLTCVFYFVEYF